MGFILDNYQQQPDQNFDLNLPGGNPSPQSSPVNTFQGFDNPLKNVPVIGGLTNILTNLGTGVGKFGEDLSKGLYGAFNAPQIEATQNQQIQNQSQLIQLAKQAQARGDTARAQSLLRGSDTSNPYQIFGNLSSPQEVLQHAGSTLAATLLPLGAVKGPGILSEAPLAARLGTIGRSAAVNAGLGALQGATAPVKEGDYQSIVRNTLEGGALGAAGGAAFPVAGALAGRGAQMAVRKGVDVMPSRGEALAMTSKLPEEPPIKPGETPVPETPGKYAFNINLDRYNLSPEEKANLSKEIETIKPQLESIKGRAMSQEEVVQAAQEHDLLQQVTTREDTVKAAGILQATRDRIAALDKQITADPNSPNVPQMTKEMVGLIQAASSEVANRGRLLQSLTVPADAESVRTALIQRILGISNDADAVAAAAAKVDFNDPNAVVKFYRDFVKPNIGEVLDEYRYNNMLSSPRTQLRNAFSNMFQTFVGRPATIAGRAVVDYIANALTGAPREYYLKEVPQYYKGVLNSLPRAVEAFQNSFSGGAILKPDLPQVPTGKLPGFLTIPTRLMEGADKFFSEIISSGEKEILAGKGVSGPLADIEAHRVAEYSLFRTAFHNNEQQGPILNAIDKATAAISNIRSDIPLLGWFVPFLRTPMNFAKQWVEYSPLGLSTVVGAANKKEQLAKFMIGSVATGIGAKFALDGNTTWAVPTDPEEKQLFYASGKKPYSVNIGGNWVSMQYAGPMALALALPAAVKYYQEDSRTALTDSQVQKITQAVASMAGFFTQQTFLQGLGNWVSLVEGNPDASKQNSLAFNLGQFIPLNGLVAYISHVVDPIYRKPQGFGETLMSSIPGLSQGLQAYQNPAGENEQRNPANLIAPYDISPANKDYEGLLNLRNQELQFNNYSNVMEKQLENSTK